MKSPIATLSRVVANAAGHLSDEARGRILAVLRQHAGAELDIVIREHETQRSLDQNAYIHAVPVTLLADFLGNTIPEMKLILMGECFGWKVDPMSGHEIPVKPATSSMNVGECQYFIDWVVPWAAQKFDGFEIPLPNEWMEQQAS